MGFRRLLFSFALSLPCRSRLLFALAPDTCRPISTLALRPPPLSLPRRHNSEPLIARPVSGGTQRVFGRSPQMCASALAGRLALDNSGRHIGLSFPFRPNPRTSCASSDIFHRKKSIEATHSVCVL